MNNNPCIGRYGGAECRVAEDSPNISIMISGVSGSGKTVCMNEIELQAVKEGRTVVIIDYCQSHDPQNMFSEISEKYESYVNRIDATEGLNLNLLQPMKTKTRKESVFNVVHSNLTAFCAGNCMGPVQMANLRNIITEAMKLQNDTGCDDAEALICVFERYSDDAKIQGVYQKLWSLLHSGVLKKGSGKQIQPGMINIFDLGGIEPGMAAVVAEIILSYLWRAVFNVRITETQEIICSLDEFQHLNLGKNSVLRSMLREGRKFGLSMLLATQTLTVFKPEEIAVLNQTATRLLFRPAETDLKRTAQSISCENVNQWMEELRKLRVGERLAIGAKEINGRVFNRPLKLR